MLKYFLPRVSLNTFKSFTSRGKIKTVVNPIKENTVVEKESKIIIKDDIEVNNY
jgi:hypothetical protein